MPDSDFRRRGGRAGVPNARASRSAGIPEGGTVVRRDCLATEWLVLDAGGVDDEHEAHALQLVLDRLQRRFADVAPEVVQAAVDSSHAALTGPIRDFVPLLVERAAAERLRAGAYTEVAPSAESKVSHPTAS